MKSTGIRRKVDDLGRVVIPAGIRRSLGIHEGDALEVSVDGEQVILAKPTDRCVFCGSEDGPLEAFRGRMICRPCVGSVGTLDDQLRRPASEAPAVRPPEAAPDDEHDAPPVRHLSAAPGSGADHTRPDPERTASRDVDERVAGVRDERREPYDPASTTAW